MEISINNTVQQSSTIGAFSANSPLVSANVSQSTRVNSGVGQVSIDTSANASPQITAPLVDATQVVTENQRPAQANIDVNTSNSNQSAINAVEGQRREVSSRKQTLSQEQRDIAKQILSLERKEAELALKKLQLKQASSVGNLVNLNV